MGRGPRATATWMANPERFAEMVRLRELHGAEDVVLTESAKAEEGGAAAPSAITGGRAGRQRSTIRQAFTVACARDTLKRMAA